jgi:[ribosomal protein S5]-alanine N-acetyltransferase
MAANHAFYWSLRRNSDASVTGCFDIAEIDWQHRRAEVGFVLAKPLWSHGYAQEVMNAIIDHVTGLGLKRLTARLHAGNMRSEALLRRLHFQQEGLLRGHIERDGTRRDCKVFGLLL